MAPWLLHRHEKLWRDPNAFIPSRFMAPSPPPDRFAYLPFGVGARVLSERWGTGTVQHYDGDSVTVLFDEHGYREMFVPVVLERGLLRSASADDAGPGGS